MKKKLTRIIGIIIILFWVFSCKNSTKKEISGCFPSENLPEYIKPLTEFGQRSEWSHDGQTVYFVDKAGGEVWKADVKTKELTQITKPEFRPEGHGYYRVYELSNGDLFFTCGPERHNLYMQILKKDGDGFPFKINESIDEGPAISRTDMKIVWTPDQQVIYSGKISYLGDSIIIKDKKLIIDNDSVVVDGIKYEGILEPQNFVPPDEELFTWTQYGHTDEGLFTSEVMVYNLETDEIFNYSKSPDQYSEPEGIFPAGEYTLMESDMHCLKGINGEWFTPLYGDQSKLTGASLQTNREDFSRVHDQVKRVINEAKEAGKVWAVACDEPGDHRYALIPDDANPEHFNARTNGLWGAMLAGAWGTEWYFGYEHPHSDLTCEDWRSRDLFWDMGKICLDFFYENDLPVDKMVCNDELVSSEGDYCYALEGDTYGVLLKKGGESTLNLKDYNGSFSVSWYDTRNGGELQKGNVKTIQRGGKKSLGLPPKDINKDWVVLVRKI